MPSETAPTVLITGAAKRIGRGLARDFAARGWQVAIHHRNSAEEAQDLVAEINASGHRAEAIAADLAVMDDVARLVPQCCEALGPPTCLINNASQFLRDTLKDLTCTTWDAHLAINLKAPVFLAQAMFNALPDGVEGNVINIIDQRVWKLTPEFFSYTISKAGLWTATRTLAQSMAPRVRVNAIGPGPVLPSVHQTSTDFETEVEGTLLKRRASPEEISAAIRFILEAPAMTGQMIALDSGQHLAWSDDPTNTGS